MFGLITIYENVKAFARKPLPIAKVFSIIEKLSNEEDTNRLKSIFEIILTEYKPGLGILNSSTSENTFETLQLLKGGQTNRCKDEVLRYLTTVWDEKKFNSYYNDIDECGDYKEHLKILTQYKPQHRPSFVNNGKGLFNIICDAVTRVCVPLPTNHLTQSFCNEHRDPVFKR